LAAYGRKKGKERKRENKNRSVNNKKEAIEGQLLNRPGKERFRKMLPIA
jgi:hypothetical protein